MNFLALAKRLRQEAGYSGNGPSTVTNQAGEARRIVDWVSSAWVDIQGMREQWRFMRHTFSWNLAAGEMTGDTAISNFKRVKPHSTVITRADGSKYRPTELSPDDMRLLVREKTNNAGLPEYFSIDDGQLTIFPTTNEAIAIEGDFYCTPKILTENNDVPSMPEHYHMAIVWYALMQIGGFDEASNLYIRGAQNFDQLFRLMTDTELPRIQPARPLA